MKSSGFDIENTYLKDIECIEKLVFLVILAFVWYYKVDIYLHQIHPIKIKKHGRMAKVLKKTWVIAYRIHITKPCKSKQYN
jgi:hypothetical protein